jgi:predicted enzyme related to lactoylglutathione lyase
MASPVTWFEIIGKDPVKLQKFYSDVFGWKLTPPDPRMGNYSLLEDGGKGIRGGVGGTLGDGSEGGPEVLAKGRVTIYIEVADPQAYLDKVSRAGGKVLMPVTEITEGTTIALFADPGGNITGLLKAVAA